MQEDFHEGQKVEINGNDNFINAMYYENGYRVKSELHYSEDWNISGLISSDSISFQISGSTFFNIDNFSG